MQKQGIVRLSICNKPLQGLDDVVLGGLHNRVLLVISQNNHILPFIAVVLNQVLRQVSGVVDASAQLALLAEVVDTDQKGATLACAVRVLEGIILGRTMAELLGSGWGRGGRARALMIPSSMVLLDRVPILIKMLRGGMRGRRVLPLLRRLVLAPLMLTISPSSLMLSVSSLLLSVAVLRLSVSSLLLPVAVLRLSVSLWGRRMMSVTLLSITLLLLRRGVLTVSSSAITLRRGLLVTPTSTTVSLTRVTAAV